MWGAVSRWDCWSGPGAEGKFATGADFGLGLGER
jgi:hypothetical protein